MNTDQIYIRLLLQLHENNNLVVLYMSGGLDIWTALATKAREHTFKNMRSSDDCATQSCTAVHFPMPPLAANLVQRARLGTVMLRRDRFLGFSGSCSSASGIKA